MLHLQPWQLCRQCPQPYIEVSVLRDVPEDSSVLIAAAFTENSAVMSVVTDIIINK